MLTAGAFFVIMLAICEPRHRDLVATCRSDVELLGRFRDGLTLGCHLDRSQVRAFLADVIDAPAGSNGRRPRPSYKLWPGPSRLRRTFQQCPLNQKWEYFFGYSSNRMLRSVIATGRVSTGGGIIL